MICSNPLCRNDLDPTGPGWHCGTCKRILCWDCLRADAGTTRPPCTYCGMPCDPLEGVATPRETSDREIATAVTKRLAMGRGGLNQKWGLCIPCGHRTYVDRLPELKLARCTRCGGAYFQGQDGSQFIGSGSTFDPSSDSFNPLQRFFEQLTSHLGQGNADALYGKVAVKNWILSQRVPIQSYQILDALRRNKLDGAADFIEKILKEAE